MEDYVSSKAFIASISQRFKQYRLDYPMTQQQLAEKSGVSLRSIQGFENGRDIQMSNFFKLLNALDLSQNLGLLIPDITERPSAFLSTEKEKKRVRIKKDQDARPKRSFVWGDER